MKFKDKIVRLFLNFYLSKWQLKVSFVFTGIALLIAVVWYTQNLLEELIQREKNTIKLYADIYQRSLEPNADLEEIAFLFDKISPTISFPVIITDENNIPYKPYKLNTRNIEIDSTLPEQELENFMINLVNKMAKEYPPVVIKDNQGRVLQKFFYTNSSLINKLRFFPIIGFIIVSVFILVGYIAFSNIRRSEESKVWVGMSKEAAHQLGTPLSSLLAWLEILKINKDNPDFIESTIKEMENDINRLNTIAIRFSKIGSEPEKKVENLYIIIETVCSYFEKRLPHIGRKVKIIRNLDRELYAKINVDLFQWVIENLLKNAAEAIEKKSGEVIISMKKPIDSNFIRITITDNGKGMTKKQKRMIFNPGYTTKKRGWGLGLSLCKRIIEEYHNGKIYVKETYLDKGTTFAIEIPKEY